jgi:hypothetical protein
MRNRFTKLGHMILGAAGGAVLLSGTCTVDGLTLVVTPGGDCCGGDGYVALGGYYEDYYYEDYYYGEYYYDDGYYFP